MRNVDQPASSTDFANRVFASLDGVDIADDDQFIVASDPCGLLVEVMASSVGDLSVDGGNATLVSGALLNGECSLIVAIMLESWDLDAVTARRQRLEPEVDANRTITGGKLVSDLALECDIPAAREHLA